MPELAKCILNPRRLLLDTDQPFFFIYPWGVGHWPSASHAATSADLPCLFHAMH